MTAISETAKIIEESRKILEHGQDTSNSSLLEIFINLASSLDKSMKRIENGINKIDEIKTTVTAMAYDIRKLTTDVKAVESKYGEMETNIQGLSNVFDDIKEKCHKHTEEVGNLNDRISRLEKELRDIPARNANTPPDIKYLRDTVLDLQCRSMKNNLIFTGLAYRQSENCEQKLRDLIYEELGIEQHIEFGNVHRFGKIGRNGVRPIVARFIYHHQLKLVLTNAYKLWRTAFGVHEQFPAKIVERRQKLYPVMNEARRNGKRTSMVRDRLYIEGKLYTTDDNDDMEIVTNNLRDATVTPQRQDRDQRRPGRPSKRPRAGSSPQPVDGEMVY